MLHFFLSQERQKGVRIDHWLEEAPYSALRILETLKELGFPGEYSIVKHYVRGKKEQLEEKATVRFETMPGLQAQVDWAFFEDHRVLEKGKFQKLYYSVSLPSSKSFVFGTSVMFSHGAGVFSYAVHRVCNRHEHKHINPLPSECFSVFSWLSGRNFV